MQTHRLITYDNQVVGLTEEQFKKLDHAVMNTDAHWLEVSGAKYAINSIKFLGPKEMYTERYSEIKRPEVPLIQAPKEETPLASLFLHGATPAGWSQSVRELAKKVWEDHLKRRPAIDARMKPLREAAWQRWNEALSKDHPKKNKRPSKLLD